MNSTLRIAWRSLGRNRKRTALALTAIAVAQLTLLVSDGLMHGYADSMLDAMTGPMLGHVQVHAPEWREERAMDLYIDDTARRLAAIRKVPGVVRASPRVYAPALAAREREGHAVVVIGIDPRQEKGRGGLLASVPSRLMPRQRRVLIGSALAREMGLHAGDELALVGQGADGSLANDLYVVAGVLRTPIDLVDRMGVVMTLGAAQETFAMPDQVHEITVWGQDADAAAPLARAIARHPALAGTEVMPWRQIAPELVTVIELSDQYGAIVLLLVFVAAAAGIANTMLMAVFERRREIGMLLALGTTPGRVVRMIVVEATALGIAGVVIGSLLGGLAVLITSHTGFNWAAMGGDAVKNLSYQGLNYDMDFYPRLEVADIVQGVVAVVLTSLLASIWPAIHTSRLEPAKALRS